MNQSKKITKAEGKVKNLSNEAMGSEGQNKCQRSSENGNWLDVMYLSATKSTFEVM